LWIWFGLLWIVVQIETSTIWNSVHESTRSTNCTTTSIF